MASGLGQVVRRLSDLDIQTRKSLEIAEWTNEEGARFIPAMFGSAVFTGSLADELHRTGYAGQRPLVCCQL